MATVFPSFSLDFRIFINIHESANEINRIHHGWSVEIGKSQPEGPSVPVGNEARRTMDPRVEIFLSPLNTTDGFFFTYPD